MADRYWRGGTGTWNTTSTTNWSISSNGSGGASVPTAADNVIFDQAGTYTVTMTGALTCLSITTSDGTVTFATGTTPSLAISGSMTFVPGTVWSSTGGITFNSTTSQTISTNGTIINGAITFNGVNGNWSLGTLLTTGSTLTTTLTAGTLTLPNGTGLTTGIFSSNNSNARTIAFGSNFINLTHTTAGQTVLSMATLTNFTSTGTGGFSSSMSVTRTFTCGTIGGSTTTAPNLLIASGASIPTITTASSFKNLSFLGSSCAPATTTLNVYGDLTLSGTGTYSALTVNMLGSVGNINSSGSTSLLGLVINNSGGTTTLTAALTLLATGITTLTSGNLDLGGFTLTTGTFVSSNTNTRSITFGTSNIILATTTAAQTVLSMATATGFTYTSSGTYGSSTGCFQSTMSTTRTFVFGTTGGSATNAPILYLVSGASIATLTTGSWFKEVNFGATGFTIAATTLNLISLTTASTTSVLTALTSNMVATGTIYAGISIGPVIVNNALVTTTFSNSAIHRCTTLAVTAGTVVIESNCILICSSTCTLNGGTLTMGGQVQCTILTIAGSNYSIAAGCSWIISTSIVVTSGSLTINYSAAGGLPAVTTFTHTAGTVTLNTPYSLSATGTYTLTAGTLTLNANLTTGIFSSSNTNIRAIAFNTFNIILAHTTAAQTVLSMATLTNFSPTGTGGFSSSMSVTRTFTCGTTAGGSITTAPNLSITSGASVPTITTAGWINNLDFTGSTCAPAATVLNLTGSLTLATGGTYTNLSINAVGTGTITASGKTITSLICSTNTATTSISGAVTLTSLIVSGGTINLLTGSTTTATITQLTFGTVNLSGGTLNVTTFTHIAGTVNVTANTVLATVAYNFISGTLNLDNNLTTSTFINNSSYPKSIIGSGTIYTLTGSGSAVWSSTSTGSVNFIASTSQYLLSSSNAALTMGTGDFTVECWWYQSVDNVDRGFISTIAANSALGVQLAGNYAYIGSNSGGITLSWTLPLNQWNHVALVRISGTARAYVNGVLAGSSADTQNLTGTQVAIGTSYTNNFSYPVAGKISNVRIVKGIGIYTGNFTVPTKPLLPIQNSSTNILAITSTQTSLLLETAFNNPTADHSSNALTITNTGAVTATQVSPFNTVLSDTSFTNFTISMTSASAKTFSGNGSSYPILNQGGAGALTISGGSNSFTDISATTKPSSIIFEAGSIQTFTNFNLSGTAGNLITVTSSTPGASYVLTRPTGVTNVNYLSLRDSIATSSGTGSWYAGNNSINVSNNQGWIFTTYSTGAFFNFFLFD